MELECPSSVGEDGAGTWIVQIIVCGCVVLVSKSSWVWVVVGLEEWSEDGAGSAHLTESIEVCDRVGIGAGAAQRDDLVKVVVAGMLKSCVDDSR